MSRQILWQMLWPALSSIGIFAGIYVIGALALLFSSSIEKREDGTLIINKNSWHYRLMKLAHYYNDIRQENMEKNGISICRYYWSLFWTVILQVPVVMTIEMIKCILYTPFMFLLGWCAKPSLTNAFECLRYGDPGKITPKWVPIFPKLKFEEHEFYLVPGWIVIPTGLVIIFWYVIKLFFWGLQSSQGFRTTCTFILVIALILLIENLIVQIRLRARRAEKREENQTNLFIEFIKAKKQKLCRIARVQ